MSIEWKKCGKKGHSSKNSHTDIKISFSIHEKQTKRRKQSRHKKLLTEASSHYALNNRKTSDNINSLEKVRED